MYKYANTTLYISWNIFVYLQMIISDKRTEISNSATDKENNKNISEDDLSSQFFTLLFIVIINRAKTYIYLHHIMPVSSDLT